MTRSCALAARAVAPSTVADVLGHAAGEQVHVLLDHAHGPPERGQGCVPDVGPVQKDAPFRQVVELRHQGAERALPAPEGPTSATNSSVRVANAAAEATGGAYDPDAAFEQGLALMLDGLGERLGRPGNVGVRKP